jgi:hypothetical protein
MAGSWRLKPRLSASLALDGKARLSGLQRYASWPEDHG